jgi:hypothetical protein
MFGVSVADIVDIFWYIFEQSKFYFYTGLGIFAFGAICLVLGFKFIPEAKKVFVIMFSPVMGCGCLVLLVPFVVSLGIVLTAGGVIAVCEDSPAC